MAEPPTEQEVADLLEAKLQAGNDYRTHYNACDRCCPARPCVTGDALYKRAHAVARTYFDAQQQWALHSTL